MGAERGEVQTPFTPSAQPSLSHTHQLSHWKSHQTFRLGGPRRTDCIPISYQALSPATSPEPNPQKLQHASGDNSSSSAARRVLLPPQCQLLSLDSAYVPHSNISKSWTPLTACKTLTSLVSDLSNLIC